MAERKGGVSPLDELRRVNEKVAVSKRAAAQNEPGEATPSPVKEQASSTAQTRQPRAAAAAPGNPKPEPATAVPDASPAPEKNVREAAGTASAAAPRSREDFPEPVDISKNHEPIKKTTFTSRTVPSETAVPKTPPAAPARTPAPESAARQAQRPAAPAQRPAASAQRPAASAQRPAASAQRPASAPRPTAYYQRPAQDMSGTIVYSSDQVNNLTGISPAVTGKSRNITPKNGVARPQSAAANPNRKAPPKKTAAAESGKDGDYSSAFEETVGRGVISSAMKAVIYIVCVLVISGCLSLFTVLVANDVFAFVKTGDEVTVTLKENASVGDIADILHDKDVIKYPSVFKLYCKLRHKIPKDSNYLSGDFTVAPTMGYDELINTFLPSANSRTELTITIIEGMNVDEIIDLFVEKGIGTREGFVDTIQNYDFDYWFVDELDVMLKNNPDCGRKYRLEGYLFPDTYNFYSNATEADVIGKLLENFSSKFDEGKREQAAAMGYTTDQMVVMASMIQKEAMYVTDYPKVASVFFNRLNDGMKLDSNATVQYMMPREEVELKLTYDQIEKYDTPYNTYKHSGLPVGPICNPSLNAFNWALNPEDTDYYYFVSDKQGYNRYARTNAEHERNIAAIEAEPDPDDGE